MRKALLMLLLAWLAAAGATAQRRVTPVTPTPTGTAAPAKETEFDRTRLHETLDAKGNIVLVDTVTGLEWVDSTATRIPRMEYPRVSSLTVGVNFFDALMRAFGQKWGLADASLTVGFHNRYFAAFEAGMGQCSDSPSGSNFSYRSPASVFFKLGGDYNFFYNNTAAYRLTLGLRYGLAPAYSYHIDNVTVDNGYWQTISRFDISRQTATTGWIELLLGLKVKIAGPVAMGWSVRWHRRLHSSGGTAHGAPMYIPGFGKWGSSVGATMSVFVDIFSKTPSASTPEPPAAPALRPEPEPSNTQPSND